jgi:hypothetical protein
MHLTAAPSGRLGGIGPYMHEADRFATHMPGIMGCCVLS